jgi:hypothetical protein
MSRQEIRSATTTPVGHLVAKSRLFLILAFILCNLPINLSAQSATESDVRKLKWGMSKEKVKSIEGAQKWDASETHAGIPFIFYVGKAAGLECALSFYFVENKLVEILYLFVQKHAEENLYVDDFFSVSRILDSKYGEGARDQIWKNERYSDTVDKWGLALALGHATFFTIYDNEKTIIDHTITGDNYQINHYVSFKSKDHQELVEKHTKDAADDF